MHLPAKVNSLFVQTFMANEIPSDSDLTADPLAFICTIAAVILILKTAM